MDTGKQVPVKEGLTDVDVLRLVGDGVAKDGEGREWEVLAVGSAVVLLPWFMVEFSPSPGGDTPSELPLHAAVVGVVSVLPSPPSILVVEGDGRDMYGREWEVPTLGSAVIPLPWSMVELSSSPGEIVALLPREALVTEGEGLPVGDGVAVPCPVGCPCVRAVELSSAVHVSVLLPRMGGSLALVVPEEEEEEEEE